MIRQLVVIQSTFTLFKSLVDASEYDPFRTEHPTEGPTIPPDLDEEWPNARHQGLMLAGMSEFNWLVDVRTPVQDQDEWAIGNIVTYYNVLTTCHAVITIVDTKDSPILQVTRETLTVDFCTTYLWNDFEQTAFGAIGQRLVTSITISPLCAPNSFVGDFAILRLEKGIHPFVPLRGYLPIPKTWPKPYFDPIIDDKMICYIATFGKNYRNVRPPGAVMGNMLLDHKIKFRVYHVEWEDCMQFIEKICPSKSVLRCSSPRESFASLKNLMMCLRPRKKVGALCDHDRGAPLVCEGFVYGIVVAGVHKENCHNLIQYPVLVYETRDFIEKINLNISTGFLFADIIQSKCSRNVLDTILKTCTIATILFYSFHL